MKLLTTASIFIAFIFIGCSKNNDAKPGDNINTITKTPTESIPAVLSADDSAHLVAFRANPQMVNTSISGSNLIMIFNENIDLLFTADGYSKTSAVHLVEDFSNSLLKGFDYTTVAEAGNITNNWVDDNLNNVILKTISDTIINNKPMIKINVHRPFTFFKIYDSAQSALAGQNVLLLKLTDSVSFSSYCYYNQVNYPKTATAAKIVYTK